MLDGDERDPLDRLAAGLLHDDPHFARALREGHPRPPREYRQARQRRGLLFLACAVCLALAAVLNSRPVISGACLLVALASGLAATLVTFAHPDVPGC